MINVLSGNWHRTMKSKQNIWIERNGNAEKYRMTDKDAMLLWHVQIPEMQIHSIKQQDTF